MNVMLLAFLTALTAAAAQPCFQSSGEACRSSDRFCEAADGRPCECGWTGTGQAFAWRLKGAVVGPPCAWGPDFTRCFTGTGLRFGSFLEPCDGLVDRHNRGAGVLDPLEPPKTVNPLSCKSSPFVDCACRLRHDSRLKCKRGGDCAWHYVDPQSNTLRLTSPLQPCFAHPADLPKGKCYAKVDKEEQPTGRLCGETTPHKKCLGCRCGKVFTLGKMGSTGEWLLQNSSYIFTDQKCGRLSCLHHKYKTPCDGAAKTAFCQGTSETKPKCKCLNQKTQEECPESEGVNKSIVCHWHTTVIHIDARNGSSLAKALKDTSQVCHASPSVLPSQCYMDFQAGLPCTRALHAKDCLSGGDRRPCACLRGQRGWAWHVGPSSTGQPCDPRFATSPPGPCQVRERRRRHGEAWGQAHGFTWDPVHGYYRGTEADRDEAPAAARVSLFAIANFLLFAAAYRPLFVWQPLVGSFLERLMKGGFCSLSAAVAGCWMPTKMKITITPARLSRLTDLSTIPFSICSPKLILLFPGFKLFDRDSQTFYCPIPPLFVGLVIWHCRMERLLGCHVCSVILTFPANAT